MPKRLDGEDRIKLSRLLDVDPRELGFLSDEFWTKDTKAAIESATGPLEAHKGDTRTPFPPPTPRPQPSSIPILGRGMCGADRIVAPTERVGELDVPADVASVPDAYAVEVVGESMAPRLTPGDIVVVNPNSTPRRGDIVVVQLAENDGGASAIIKEFGGYGSDDGSPTPKRLTVWEYRETPATDPNAPLVRQPARLDFPLEQVKAVHRVVMTRHR